MDEISYNMTIRCNNTSSYVASQRTKIHIYNEVIYDKTNWYHQIDQWDLDERLKRGHGLTMFMERHGKGGVGGAIFGLSPLLSSLVHIFLIRDYS